MDAMERYIRTGGLCVYVEVRLELVLMMMYVGLVNKVCAPRSLGRSRNDAIARGGEF
jgi:hypothetical protein